jgi:hypothetical protein
MLAVKKSDSHTINEVVKIERKHKMENEEEI